MNERMGTRPWVAHTKLDYARMAARQVEGGESADAARLVDDAIATYDALGMTAFRDRAETLRDSLVPPLHR